jgi:UDPglucose 6-dehydrogenase
MKTIGLVGKGFVGNAVYEGMKHAFRVRWFDIAVSSNIESDYSDLEELVKVVDGPIFLCLPTPMNSDGSCNTSIVEGVISQINQFVEDINYSRRIPRGTPGPILIIKSTVVPGTTEIFNAKYEYVQCVFNPEFLRENYAVEDFKNQDHIIIGGLHKAVDTVEKMYQTAYPGVATNKTSSTIAETIKYFTNCFLAVKLSFANEIYQICTKLNIDYDKVVEYATVDKRLGTSHWAVPGWDGKVGWGHKCLPKDLNALITLARNLKVQPAVMEAAWNKNLELRPKRDY